MLNSSNIYTDDLHNMMVQVWKNPHVLNFADCNYTDCYIAEGVTKFLQNIEQLDPNTFFPDFDWIKCCRRKTTGIVELCIPCDKHQALVKCFDGMHSSIVTH